jgi:hypothetical protein
MERKDEPTQRALRDKTWVYASAEDRPRSWRVRR